MQKGTYCIIFNINSKLTITVKSGKTYNLSKGTYAYIGSAWNSGGIKSRIKRHLKTKKRKHWHLDFITTSSQFEAKKIIAIPNEKVECEIASLLNKIFKGIESFGCSDCNCHSHLFKITNSQKLINILQNLYNIETYKPSLFTEEQIENKRNS